MTSRSMFLGVVIALAAGLIMAGCASTLPGGAGPAARGRADIVAGDSDSELETRIETLAHYATGLSYELNEKPQAALEEMVLAAETDPGSEPVVIEAARRCLRAQKIGEAIELLTKATSRPNASGDLYAWLGLAYAQAGKSDLAMAASRAAIKRAPESLAAYQNLTQLYLQNSRTNEALAVLDEASRQETDNPDFLIDLAELYVRYFRAQGPEAKDLRGKVENLLERATGLHPTSPLDVLRLADTYFALGELMKAEPFYRQLVDEHPDLPALRSKLTEIYLRNGQKEKASEQLEALAESEPTNPQAYLALGVIAAEEKKFGDAAEHFERALKLDPDLEQVYYDLAGLKITLKKPEEAIALLEKARSRFKLSFPMEFYSGLAYGAAKNYTEALKYLTSAEAIARATDPSRLNHLFYFQMGATQERAGHIEEAEKYFRECLKLEPDDPEALNYLGYMWAEKGIKLDQAHDLIQKAVRLEPANAAFLDSLAWVLFKMNKPREALEQMLKAVEHLKDEDQTDATFFDHLGDIYFALRQYDQARDAWDKALKFEPNEQIRKKLLSIPATSSAAP